MKTESEETKPLIKMRIEYVGIILLLLFIACAFAGGFAWSVWLSL